MTHYDLVIIGTGSGNSIPGPDFDGWRIAIVEQGTFGGTCLNVGCIPSKMFEYPAEIADGIAGGAPLGVTGRVDRVDWAGIRDRIFGRIDPIAASGKAYREGDECPNVTVYTASARFVGPKRLRLEFPPAADGHQAAGSVTEITADRFVLAAGSRVVLPDIEGLADTPYHTSDTVMRIDELPRRAVIVGGGFIAAEFGHILASLGTDVTQIVRGQTLLSGHDPDIRAAFTTATADRIDLRLRTTVRRARPTGDGGATLEIDSPDGAGTIETDLLLLATGRRPNGDELDVTRTGVTLDQAGRVVVDEFQQTAVEGIFALGDISSEHQLKHVANHEARVVAHNLAHPDAPIAADHRFVPAAVFTRPQIATVGMTEDDARRSGVRYVTARRDYADVAAGWAREDITGFCKVIADADSGLLLGVHIIGPEAATVIQPAITAMHFSIPALALARGQYWIHPALPEVLENALLGLPEPLGSSRG